MNSTNRGANRLLLLITGLILLALAAVALAMAVVPAVLQGWGAESTRITRSAPGWIADPAVGAVSLLTLAIGVVAVVLGVLLIVFILRQGQGRTTRLVEQHHSTTGTTLVELGVPRALLAAELDDRAEFVATRVSAYRVRRTPTLKVSVQCRRGVSPVDAARVVTEALEGLDRVLGTRIPALVQVGGGFRSRTRSRARLD